MAVNVLPADVQSKLSELIRNEKNEVARFHLELSMKNCIDMNENGKHLLCSDTGAPVYYVRMGENMRIERGFSNLYEQGKKARKGVRARKGVKPKLLTKGFYFLFLPHDSTVSHKISSEGIRCDALVIKYS